MGLKPPTYLESNPKWNEISLWLQFCYKYPYRFYGTEFHFSKRNRKFYCIDCGGTIPWRRFIKFREWKYTCCPSCEGYVHFMVAESVKAFNDMDEAMDYPHPVF